MGDLQDDLNRLPSSSGFAEIRVMLDHAKKTDIISNTGPYMAEVLRATVRTNPPQGMGADLVKNNEGDNLNHKGEPPKNPKPNEFSKVPIRLHHEFLGFKTDLPIPSPGDKIWVNFLNKNNGELKNPVYLAPVMPDETMIKETLKTIPKPREAFRKDPATGKMIPVNNDPAGLKRNARTQIATGGTYSLHGYTWEQFTSRKGNGNYSFGRSLKTQFGPPGQKFYMQDNIQEDMLSSVEVIHMFWKSIHPKSKIIVYHPTAAVKRSGSSVHDVGAALDVQVKVDGVRQKIKDVWASVIKLAAAGKLPDGGIGHYQQSTGNKITTYGTNIEPDQSPRAKNNPHYDTRVKKYWKQKKSGAREANKSTRPRSKWNWFSVKGIKGPIQRYSRFTAKEVAAWSTAVQQNFVTNGNETTDPKELADINKLREGGKSKVIFNPKRHPANRFFPPHLGHALAQMPDPPNDLPTWEQVKQLRMQLLAQGAPSLRGATV